ncbi:MAG: hypothetical protein RL114_1500 [Actinomycetota bacterium]
MSKKFNDGDPVERITKSLAESQHSPSDKRMFQRLLNAAADLIESNASSLDVKIASTTLEEMTRAFDMFAPYRDQPKVTIFGSARTTPDNPIYALTARTARSLADAGYMVVTGAGPGIMEAGMLGAGREKSIGVSIRLPFETGANSVIAGDDKYVSMRYFFTRKLMLVKESQAFLCMPGGFGTLDETFELLTLAQTAKSVPVPIVFLEIPGDPFWTPLMNTMEPLLREHGLISENDRTLYRIADSIEEAVDEIVGFYANYHSIRFVDGVMHLRIHRRIPDGDFAAIASEFAYLANDGMVIQTAATEAERRDSDHVELTRIALQYSGKGFASVRPLIDALNKY